MNTVDKPGEDFTRSWRYRLGLGLFIFGQVVLVLGLLSPLLGIGAGTAAAIVVIAEVLSLTSIVFLGKEGFLAIKSKVFGFVKEGFAAPVGRARHSIGIVLLCTNLVTTYTLMVYAWTGFEATTVDQPLPVIWGLEYAQQASLVFWLFLIGELSFLIAIYVLGADWWGRFRALFVWEKPARVES